MAIGIQWRRISFFVLILTWSSVFSAVPPLDTKQFKRAQCTIVPISSIEHTNARYLQRHRHHQTIPMAARTSNTSLNWCGYVSSVTLANPLQNSVTSVFGVWTVPRIAKSKKHTHCSIWVGMDGYSGSTVEQIGTEHGRYRGKLVRYAWFEIYPGYTYQIKGFPIEEDDRVGAQVQYVGTSSGKSVFQLTIFNYTKGMWWNVPERFSRSSSSLRNSAEWMVEAPSSTSSERILPLAKFSTITFEDCQTTIQNVTGAINNGSWQNVAIQMVQQDGNPKATASSLSSTGDSFSVTWNHQ